MNNATGRPSPLPQVVDELCRNNFATRRTNDRPLPSRDAIGAIVENLRAVLFPGYFGLSDVRPDNLAYHIGSLLDGVRRALREQIERGLCFRCETVGDHCPTCEKRSAELTDLFLRRLGEVRRLAALDVRAAYEGDPAAGSPDETIFCYPGVHAVASYRLAHELHRLHVPLIPRIITEQAHSLTGVDIHPGAEIGESFFIDHGTGVVIGETCRIGHRVRLYQGVTLGAKSFPLDEHGKPIKGMDRHPKVEDDVIIYSGATILGPVTIGRGAVIGGNVWLTRDVPPGSRVTQAQVLREEFTHGDGI